MNMPLHKYSWEGEYAPHFQCQQTSWFPKLPNFKELQENTSISFNNLRTTTNVIERQSSLTWTWATKLEEKARMLLLCILWFDRCYLNLIYFTGIVNLIYDWSRCFFSFFYSNFFFKLAYIYICFSLCVVTVFFEQKIVFNGVKLLKETPEVVIRRSQ